MRKKQRNILVIEDEAIVRSMVVSTLQRAQFQVLALEDTADAERSLVARVPDLILMTSAKCAPIDHGGLAFIEKMKNERLTQAIPIILMMPRGETESQQASLP